ncbi:TPA: helix-turn-helix transcriptional regulator [Candidatus Scatenecus faecavium]|uniref:Helix-turn-helix transcriptional regulator n=1 Tax=Candidatus Scatenecus faecavium TaxID=2840915 RepID=A0A9D1FVD2_9BACT|nr:helix-turn-helix transcriptional regulator [Candidatus Scatenecus faecavium]
MKEQKLFGKRIKELRKQRNLTQEELSEKLGVFQKQIGNIETGTTFTTMANLAKLAEVFDVDIKDLFEFDHQKPREEMVEEINDLMAVSSDEKLKTIYRIIKDITR